MTKSELEAEVERLRERVRHMNQNATDREAALQNAVSDIRSIVQYGRIDPQGLSDLLTILDKLPKDEPLKSRPPLEK